jgi:hypothetical protein
MILAGGMALQNVYNGNFKENSHAFFSKAAIIILIAGIVMLTIPIFTGLSLHFISVVDFRDSVALTLSSFSLGDALILNAALLLFTGMALFIWAKKGGKWILIPVLGELILHSWIALAFTGVGRTPVSSIQTILENYPEGFVMPLRQPVRNNTSSDSITSLLGHASYYNKQIGVPELTDYPSYFTNTAKALASVKSGQFLNRSFVFAEDSGARIEPTDFGPQYLEVNYETIDSTSIIYLQNDFNGWKVLVNGKETEKQKAFGSFLSVKVAPGKGRVKFYFTDRVFSSLFIFSSLLLLIVLIIFFRKSRSLKSFNAIDPNSST